MSDPTKPKFPDTKNGELRGLYGSRETLEKDTAQREAALGGRTQDEKDAHADTISRQRAFIAEINKRIETLEKLESKAATPAK